MMSFFVTAEPLERYEAFIQQHGYHQDAKQRQVMVQLNALYCELIKPRSIWQKLRGKPRAITGIYLWGGVGRGKTWMMDLFYESLPFQEKRRLHFYHFMENVHQQLRELHTVKNPLQHIAKQWAQTTRVLCFDEFFVNDIADAMLLAGLLKALFDHSVTLVATSNLPPDSLYKNGLQRARFLPAIELLKQHCRVLHLDSEHDYRQQTLQETPHYLSPITPKHEQQFAHVFDCLVEHNAEVERDGALVIHKRTISFVAKSGRVLWCRFEQLCEGPRSQRDYIELSKRFDAVLLEGVPQLSGQQPEAVRRFIQLVDEFYDQGVQLWLLADVPLNDLYQQGSSAFEFERTASRLAH